MGGMLAMDFLDQGDYLFPLAVAGRGLPVLPLVVSFSPSRVYYFESITSIVSQAGSISYLDGYGWDGDFSEIDLAKMYKVYVNSDTEITLTAPEADPTQHPIAVKKGSNWIGFPVQQAMTVDDALAGLTPTKNDKLKSMSKTTTYTGTSWFGTLTTLEPNHGYIYASQNSTTLSFTYPTGAKADIPALETPTAWTPVRSRFPGNMNVLAVLNLDGVAQSDNDIEIGAFVNGECRDAVRLQRLDETQQDLALLTISGDDGETVSFKALVNGNAIDLVETVTIHIDDMIGDFDSPFVLNNATSLTLFPNPASKGDRIQMATSADLNGATVEIFNALGALVRTETLGQGKELDGLRAAGIYTVKVTDLKGNVLYGKLVVR